jgi:flavin-binding protein dodecin
MTHHVYKKTEVVGTSPSSIEDAVNTALARAAKTVRSMRWFEIKEIRGHIEDQKLSHWQVVMQVGFTLED